MARALRVPRRTKTVPDNPIYKHAAPFRLPLWIALSTLGIYWFASEQVFLEAWRTPKIGDAGALMYMASCVVAHGFASWVAAHAVLREESLGHSDRGATPRGIPEWYLVFGLAISLIAYAVWGTLGVLRAGGVGNLLALRAAQPWFVKRVVLETVPGITTLTQVSVLAVPLWFLYSQRSKMGWALVWALIVLAGLRSQLFAERLALLELLVPLGFLALSSRQLRAIQVFRLGLLAVTGLLVFFTISELSRSFLVRDIAEGFAVLQAGAERLMGYYLTSINNAVLWLNTRAFEAPFSRVLAWLWRFPGLEGLYESLTGITLTATSGVLQASGLNPEFNTITAIGSWVVDFGTVGGLLWAGIRGAAAGAIWAMAPRDRLMAALYSVVLVAALELMRIDYLVSTRLFPAYVFWFGAMILRSMRSGRSRKRW